MEKQNEEYVTKAEMNEFGVAVQDVFKELRKDIDALRSELGEPRELALYRCGEEGCDFVTDDLGAFVGHTVDEKLGKLTMAPEETVSVEPRLHKTVKDYLDCPNCFPKFEKIMLERGWKKPEPERDRALIL